VCLCIPPDLLKILFKNVWIAHSSCGGGYLSEGYKWKGWRRVNMADVLCIDISSRRMQPFVIVFGAMEVTKMDGLWE
jgi:hypothetical protein